MQATGEADWRISLYKLFTTGGIFVGTALVTAFLNEPAAAIPLGAVVVGAWNYIKHKWLGG